ncbi:MAG: hypothetical protein OXC40_05335 [Proteobacteria bacterium]|nr:hypothetical protein [Pseudomonadota bacterium]
MTNTHIYKAKIRHYQETNPQISEEKFLQYCEELMPAREYPAYKWLIERSVTWFRYHRSVSS